MMTCVGCAWEHARPETICGPCRRQNGGAVVAVAEPPRDDSERCFMARVIKVAEDNGWMVYHTHDSRRSEPGYPDMHCVRGQQEVYAELKRIGCHITAEQYFWGLALIELGRDWRLWTPLDWAEIVSTLTDAPRCDSDAQTSTDTANMAEASSAAKLTEQTGKTIGEETR